MGVAFAFGLGVLVGALLSFRAGGRYALAKEAHAIAMEHVGVARQRWARTGGSLAVFAAVVVGGLLIMFFS